MAFRRVGGRTRRGHDDPPTLSEDRRRLRERGDPARGVEVPAVAPEDDRDERDHDRSGHDSGRWDRTRRQATGRRRCTGALRDRGAIDGNRGDEFSLSTGRGTAGAAERLDRLSDRSRPTRGPDGSPRVLGPTHRRRRGQDRFPPLEPAAAPRANGNGTAQLHRRFSRHTPRRPRRSVRISGCGHAGARCPRGVLGRIRGGHHDLPIDDRVSHELAHGPLPHRPQQPRPATSTRKRGTHPAPDPGGGGLHERSGHRERDDRGALRLSARLRRLHGVQGRPGGGCERPRREGTRRRPLLAPRPPRRPILPVPPHLPSPRAVQSARELRPLRLTGERWPRTPSRRVPRRGSVRRHPATEADRHPHGARPERAHRPGRHRRPWRGVWREWSGWPRPPPDRRADADSSHRSGARRIEPHSSISSPPFSTWPAPRHQPECRDDPSSRISATPRLQTPRRTQRCLGRAYATLRSGKATRSGCSRRPPAHPASSTCPAEATRSSPIRPPRFWRAARSSAISSSRAPSAVAKPSAFQSTNRPRGK